MGDVDGATEDGDWDGDHVSPWREGVYDGVASEGVRVGSIDDGDAVGAVDGEDDGV